jgi:predicted SAM-dependent methyltransferase
MKNSYINIGCGAKYHKDWTNIDMAPNNPDIINQNFLNGIPFPDYSFDVVYHSQVLEHFPKEKALYFMSECYRILNNEGIIRIVVPDLENIIDEYKHWLEINKNNPTDESIANYDWIMLELFDQTVRSYSGGLMADFLRQKELKNEKYIVDRIGFVGRSIREHFLNPRPQLIYKAPKSLIHYVKFFLRPVKKLIEKTIFNKVEFDTPEYKLGKFRLSGEIHFWMYDRYSLTRLLKEVGFKDIKIKDPFNSDIPNWQSYELDVKDGLAYDPTSLFIEARK